MKVTDIDEPLVGLKIAWRHGQKHWAVWVDSFDRGDCRCEVRVGAQKQREISPTNGRVLNTIAAASATPVSFSS